MTCKVNGKLCPREMKTMSSQNPIHEFYSSLIWNNQNLETTNMSFKKWMDKSSNICTTEHYSAINRSRLLIRATTWTAIEGVMLSEKSQYQRSHTVQFHLYNILKMTKLERWRADGWLPGAGDGRAWGPGGTVRVVGRRCAMMKWFCFLIVVGVTQICSGDTVTWNYSHTSYQCQFPGFMYCSYIIIGSAGWGLMGHPCTIFATSYAPIIISK